ncbi:putative reverse transcriptase domain-containing protein [Tanacetum coccineum]
MEEYCRDDEVQKLESKFWNHKMVVSDIDGYTARFHKLARLMPHMVTLESQRVNRYIWGLAPEIKAYVTSSKPATIQGAMSMANCLTTDGIKDRLFKKKENDGNKRRARTMLTSICWSTSIVCKMQLSSFWRNCPRMNRATATGGNHLNPVLAIEGNSNPGNNRNQTQRRAFALGVAKAPQDLNVVTGTFSLNDHFATVLFDSGADYSFISTNLLPLINMKPSGHTFIIDLIPFGHGSFDVIVRMDWLSKLRAKIVCYEKIVQILLSNGEILEVYGERPEWNMKQLKTMKVNEPKLKDILVVREFPVEITRRRYSQNCIQDEVQPFGLTNAPMSKEEHEVHLKLILELREKEKLFSKILKYEFLLQEVHFLGHVVNSEGKANVVADALSWKEWMKLRRARASSMKIHSSIKARILEAQSEASKGINTPAKMLKGLDKRTLIMNEAHATTYSIHPGADKMYYDLQGLYWRPGMNKDIAMYQSLQKALGTRLDLSTAYHPKTDGQSERTVQTLEDMLRACTIDFGGNWDTHLPLVEFQYNNSYHSSVKCAPFEALYGRKIKSRTRSPEELCRQSSKPLEFSVGDNVLLKVSPWKGVVRFSKRRVHDTFHVSNLKKCLADVNLHVPLEEVKIDDKLHFVEEPMEIMDRDVKKLKKRRIPIVKVRWNSRRGPEYTWELEDEMKCKYSQLFMSDTA